MKTRPMGAEFFHADGRTDGRTDRQTDGQTYMTKLTVAFSNFSNAPKELLILPVWRHARCLEQTEFSSYQAAKPKSNEPSQIS
jgi:hypothetical protein